MVAMAERKRKLQKSTPRTRIQDAVSACQAAFAGRDDLKRFGTNARLLFALQIRFGIDDIESVAVNSLTDGPDDKKCDLIYVDREKRIAVIAQAHEPKTRKASGSANKAADLLAAVAWSLGEELSSLPKQIRNAAKELREALSDKSVGKVHVWFVHPAAESNNVRNELRAVERQLKQILRDGGWPHVRTEVIEVGSGRMGEWYTALTSPIHVSESFRIPVPGCYEIHDPKGQWQAAVTAVPLTWLHSLFAKHRGDIFSANIRNYLGTRDSDDNINNNIRISAVTEPTNFWVYNNGLTAIVHSYTLHRHEGDRLELEISGVSIVNGAQTTGVIGNIKEDLNAAAMVPVRFVKTPSRDIIRNIIRYNNSQNRVNAADFRSNDKIQRELRAQFERDFPDLVYLGGRRGGDTDAISRPKGLIPSDTAAQALAAFHGEPGLAYKSKGKIWEDNTTYNSFFNEMTTAKHIVFVYALLREIEQAKSDLRDVGDGKLRTRSEETARLFFSGRGATYLLVSALGSCLDTFSRRPIPNTFRASFGVTRLPSAMATWRPIVGVALALCDVLQPAVDAGLKEVAVRESLANFRRLLEMTKQINAPTYSEFSRRIILD